MVHRRSALEWKNVYHVVAHQTQHQVDGVTGTRSISHASKIVCIVSHLVLVIHSGPADAIQVRASKRVQLLAVGAHVPSGPSSFEISIWDGNKRLHYTSLRRETRDDSKDLVVGTAVRLPLADGGYVMERDKTYTVSVLQRGKNTPSVQGCVSRARGGPPSMVLSAMGNGQGSSSGVEWTFANNTPNVTGLGDNGTSDTRGQLPCFWYKVMMG